MKRTALQACLDCRIKTVLDLSHQVKRARHRTDADAWSCTATSAMGSRAGIEQPQTPSRRNDDYFRTLRLQLLLSKSRDQPLKVAIDSESKDLLLQAVEDAGLLSSDRRRSEVVFSDYAQKAMCLLAEFALVEAVSNGDANQIEALCESELAQAVLQAEVLDAARARADALKRASGTPATVSEKLERAFCIGKSTVHDRLARLLGMALAKHGDNELSSTLLKKVDMKYSRIFPDRSFGDGKTYGSRGGRLYFRPNGWVRFSLHVQDFKPIKKWPVAYHGTHSANTLPILAAGLKRPGESGVTIAHGQAYSSSQRTIYLSPSVEYAAFPVYAQFFELGPNHWAQLVLQCRVRPHSIVERPGSLRNKYWPQNIRFDPNFPDMTGLEWLVEDSQDVVVYGMLIREFGFEVDANIYGQAALHVHPGDHGPEFVWTNMRSKDFQARGFLVT